VITTLLFDLDDTLIGNDMGVFLPAYFKLVTQHFAGAPGVERMVPELINATRAMIANNDPARTLSAVFSECFSEAMGWEPAWWRERIDEFYVGSYRQLEALTTRRPAARQVMEWARTQGLEVGITTNPLFPLPAITERLRWAGLADFDFAVVTDFDHSHFAKPHPEYFAEALARLGRRPEQTLVVGNDWERDIVPAAAVGIRTYFIKHESTTDDRRSTTEGETAKLPPVDRPLGGMEWVAVQNVGQGALEDFAAWAPTHLPALPEAAAPPHRALPYFLSGNLAAFHDQLDGLPESGWCDRPAAGEWSLTEMTCHLRDVEREVNLPRLRALAEQVNPFISGADTDPWAVERDYQSQDGPAALAAFSAARKEAITFLRRQPEDIWTRTARHAIFGPTLLAEIVGWVMDHDRIHLDQVKKTRERV
jgi:FMN phosphatase YigB (HAD superfamily)